MKFIQNKEVFATDLDNEVCIFNPENGEYINLNTTATEIWNIIEESKNIDSILDSLHKIYEGELEIIKENLLEFLEEGIKNGFITKLN